MKIALFLYLRANLESRGIAALHGPHNVPQNSTAYTLPFSNFSTGLPLLAIRALAVVEQDLQRLA